MNAPDLRTATRTAIMAMDQDALSRAGYMAGITQQTELFYETSATTLVAAPHEIQQFWLGDCACHRDVPQIKVAVCRPVVLTPEIEALTERTGTRLTVYPGSTISQCSKCGVDIYVGPRQQEAIAANADIAVMCMECAVITTANEADGDSVVHNLGNMFTPKGN